MISKIKIKTINDSPECPFYVENAKGSSFCFIKRNISLPIAVSAIENTDHYDDSLWESDCGGCIGKCSVLPLLYTMDDKSKAIDPPVLHSSSGDLEDFNPFQNEEFNEKSNEESQEKSNVDRVPSEDSDNADDDNDNQNSEDLIKVKIVEVNNIYSVKVDGLIYPANQMLFIDDNELDRRSRGNIQKELDALGDESIKQGAVYRTSNGGDHKHGVVPKTIYHAVVASESRLVNEGSIEKSVIKALILADQDKCVSVAMLPMDCGTFDLHKTAHKQLSAIYNFLSTYNVENLSKIYIITDKKELQTKEIFKEYFYNIFE